MKKQYKTISINLLNRQKKQNNSFKVSLLVFLVGIFLLPQIAYFSSITPERIIELTNQERSKNGLPKLTANQLLTKAANAKGLDILKTQTFKHEIDGKKFSSWIKEANYKYSYAGENLAIDFLTSEGAIKAWMASQTHRDNILNNNFTEIGVAIVEGDFNGQKSIIIVESFGNPPVTISRLSVPETNAQISGAIQIGENLLTHSLSKNQNTNLVPGIAEKISLDNDRKQNIGQIHWNSFYLSNLITPLQFLPITFGITSFFALIYLYISSLLSIIKLTQKSHSLK